MSRTARTRKPVAPPFRPRPSTQVNADQLARIQSLSRDEREAAARRGDFDAFTLGTLCRWAAGASAGEVPLVNNEFAFIALHLADLDPD